ncbi:phosphate ABC transporter, inner membrane subunit PstA [Paenibacillus algicola]|uniref:Phosphate transport system permease protein PstA n=2 Tax=Paenibacillus TaxID=44249 RepID=A0A4V1G3W9_9BACL|nr:phosphate ABC transporter, inner membrane subunit PstA [Paenibacillus algicola]
MAGMALQPGGQPSKAHQQVRGRKKRDQWTKILFLGATSIGILALMVLIIDILIDGLATLRPELLTNYPSRRASGSGLKSALIGTFYMVCIMAPISFLIGVGAAIFMEEYAKKNKLTRLIQLNISTLAGVPSIVYGILGLAIFVRGMNLERSLLSGALTMTLLVLPVIIVSAQEAIKAVPSSRRDASLALGATKWQTVQRSVLPSAFPGILTGIILAISRAIGETAPLVMIGALTYVAFLPNSLLDQFTVLPIQIYNWISKPQTEFHDLAASGIIILLIMLLSLNMLAVVLRNRFQKNL